MHSHNELVASGLNNARDIGVEAIVPAAVGHNLLAVDPHRGVPVHSPKVQQRVGAAAACKRVVEKRPVPAVVLRWRDAHSAAAHGRAGGNRTLIELSE